MTGPAQCLPERLGGVPCSAIFFDVDFTLIYPGPTFEAEGYQRFCTAYGIEIDPTRYGAAVRHASAMLDGETEHVYDDAIFVRFIRRVIEAMGGTGDRLNACAGKMWAEWAACHHFRLYDDVHQALNTLSNAGLKIGLISNSHRCLASFQAHFELEGLIDGAVSSSEHGYLKPHASIFEAALKLLDAVPAESVMVGDSLAHDIRGALAVGMGGVLVHRSTAPAPEAGVPVIRTLMELPDLILAARSERDPQAGADECGTPSALLRDCS
jgi:putative hydrolase of the HAD superfamily